MMHETETHDGEIVEMHRFADIRTLLFNYKKEGRKEGSVRNAYSFSYSATIRDFC